MLYQSV